MYKYVSENLTLSAKPRTNTWLVKSHHFGAARWLLLLLSSRKYTNAFIFLTIKNEWKIAEIQSLRYYFKFTCRTESVNNLWISFTCSSCWNSLLLSSANLLPAVCVCHAIPSLVLTGYWYLNSSVCLITFDVIILFNYGIIILLN